jgi:hypothetical protein
MVVALASRVDVLGQVRTVSLPQQRRIILQRDKRHERRIPMNEDFELRHSRSKDCTREASLPSARTDRKHQAPTQTRVLF